MPPGWSRLLVVLALLLPGGVAAQTVRGRVFDQARHPLAGALVELRDSAGGPVQLVVTAASGGFVVTAPAPGSYRIRFAAIGFQPRPYAVVDVPDGGAVLADIVLVPNAVRLPDLVALSRGRHCGRSGLSDDLYLSLLDNAHNALQIIEATMRSGTTRFEVARITTRTLYGTFFNVAVADTSVQPLTRWPVQSIDPDTLRAVGFSRTLEPGDENTRQYYGPDPRVLFADWFLASHCFTLDKMKKRRGSDTLHLRFVPARKSKLVDVAGELVLDARDLSLLEFSFVLKNLPGWMPDEASGGQMQFARLPSGLWMTRSWAIWAPIAGMSPFDSRLSVAGEMETYGWVSRVIPGDPAAGVK